MLITDPAGGLVRAFDSEGRSLGQFGEPGNGSGQFSVPTGLRTNSKGELLVTDTGNKRVEEWIIE